jgi:ectoine hydroxylase-related dioxygenase (phytanoyl-CoA dioxygenase family)
MSRTTDLDNLDQQRTLQGKFREDGYVFLPGFLNREEIRTVRAKLSTFIKHRVKDMPPEQVYYEDKSDRRTLKQLQQLFAYDDFFREMMFESRFERLASILLEDSVVGKNLQYFNKPPRIGKSTPAHQDGYYFMLNPPEAVTMWMALETVDEENGCVRYVRGSHKKGMRPHAPTQTLGFSQGISDFGTEEDLNNEVHFPAKAGDLLVHHALTIHRANGNRSTTRTRQALGFIYYAAQAQEDLTAREAYQRKLDKNLKQQAHI